MNGLNRKMPKNKAGGTTAGLAEIGRIKFALN
jgi:hypothetical protein